MKCVPFFEAELGLTLTASQRELVRVAIDRQPPSDLGRTLFGTDVAPEFPRDVHVWRLGRNSGKTTLASGVALYEGMTRDLSRCGPGSQPTVLVVAPRLDQARISVRMMLAMVTGSSSLRKRLVEPTKDSFTLRRYDGRTVHFRAIAAARGGVTGRGLDVVAFLADESEFFASETNYVITDRDIFAAIQPRLIGPAIFISTPWPAPNLTAELVDKNYANPTTALVAVGTTVVMRDHDPAVVRAVEALRDRDPETAAREHDCDGSATGSGAFFDSDVVTGSVFAGRAYQEHESAAAGGDLALVRDSSALTIGVRYASGIVQLLEVHEWRPQKFRPLVLADVVAAMAGYLRPFRIRNIISDEHARLPANEVGQKHGVQFNACPGGADFKEKSYFAFKNALAEHRLLLPDHPRLLAQLRSIMSKPTASGRTQIIAPRRAGGGGHGDLVSSAVLAFYALSDAQSRGSGITQFTGGARRDGTGMSNSSKQALIEAGRREDARYNEAVRNGLSVIDIVKGTYR